MDGKPILRKVAILQVLKTVFLLRARMFPTKENFSGRWENKKCYFCEEVQTDRHLFICAGMIGQFMILNSVWFHILTNRLVSGYTNLNEYLNKISSVISPNCTFCDEPESTYHFIYHCERITRFRCQLLNDIKKILQITHPINFELWWYQLSNIIWTKERSYESNK